METKNATVTLPYEEFEKMRRDLERIANAEDFEDKVTKGDFVPRSEIRSLEIKLFVMSTIATEQYSAVNSTKSPKSPHQTANKYGYSLGSIELNGEHLFQLKEVK